jgi:hypothetical protein
MAERILKNTREEDLERRLAKFKTKINMLKYYLHKQIHYHEPAYGNPDTNLDMAIIGMCETIIGKLDE